MNEIQNLQRQIDELKLLLNNQMQLGRQTRIGGDVVFDGAVEMRAGKFLALTTGIQPTDADASGSFVSAAGETFGSYLIRIGEVLNGVLQAGFGAGAMIAGGGDVVADADGITVHTPSGDITINDAGIVAGALAVNGNGVTINVNISGSSNQLKFYSLTQDAQIGLIYCGSTNIEGTVTDKLMLGLSRSIEPPTSVPAFELRHTGGGSPVDDIRIGFPILNVPLLEVGAVSQPNSGQWVLYALSDGIYSKDDANNEKRLAWMTDIAANASLKLTPWVTGIDAKTLANTTLYTVPTGKKAIFFLAFVRVAALTFGSKTINAHYSLGITPTYDQMIANNTVISTVVESTNQMSADFADMIAVPAGTAIKMSIITASDATSETWAVQALINEFDA